MNHLTRRALALLLSVTMLLTTPAFAVEVPVEEAMPQAVQAEEVVETAEEVEEAEAAEEVEEIEVSIPAVSEPQKAENMNQEGENEGEGEKESGGDAQLPTELEQVISGLKESYSIQYKKNVTLKPESNAEGADFTYATSDAKIATVTKEGLIKAVGVGQCIITVNSAAVEGYTDAEATVTVKVSKLKPTIRVQEVISKKFAKNGKIELKATTDGESKLTYKSSSTAIATVSSKGVVVMQKSGTCTITITSAASANCAAATKTVTLHLFHRARSMAGSIYKKSAYYKRLAELELSGTARENMLAIASSQIGYHEGTNSRALLGTGKKIGNIEGGNYTEYGRFYGYNGVPWCAIFVNWCARENNISYSAIPKYCAVRDYTAFYKRKGRFHSWTQTRQKKYQPKQGDIILYSDVKSGVTHHIGYVLSSTYTSKYVTIVTVEGNTKDTVKKVTMKMSRSSSSGKVDGHYIYGFANPKY